MSAVKPYRSFVDRLWPRMHHARKSDHELLAEIRKRSKEIENCGEAKLLQLAEELKVKIQIDGLPVLSSNAVVESFSLTTEALRMTTGKIYYDCQLLGGLVLATGAIAEMQTGEGKTVTCGLPSVLYGLTGKGVHVATTNAYLAERDHEELVPVLSALGLTSALIQNDQDVFEKKQAYQCDITYGTGYEFGFDFLRDQMAIRNQPELQLGTRFLCRMRGMPEHDVTLMQRPLSFAIIDEADSVLIDEATTPLILSGSSGITVPDPHVYKTAMKIADMLEQDSDFEIDWIKNSVTLTDSGWKLIHDQLPGDVQSLLQRPWSQYVEQSIHARLLLKRDTDYVVSNDEIVIVDANTGRLHEERKWRSGLHQAIEMRENVPMTEEREIEARITRQRYFAFYDKVAGMTGTAMGNEAELLEFYDLPIVKIERNKASKRKTVQARYFADTQSKYNAIAEEAISRAAEGQPVLVGTRTIIQSREIAEILKSKNQPHIVLNGTQDDDEASIISSAGRSGCLTIATNMAGRGTDIKLDDESRAAGGLHVIVAEHHDSPRVDRQLIGRSARQSDPGSCQFFVSAEDEIIKRYEPGLAKALKRSADKSTGECRSNFDSQIRALQARIELIGFKNRKKMVVHDRWMESVQKSVAKLA
ncbi:MAG: preprotein translocase subunit SecA [Mariniblastus sp.]